MADTGEQIISKFDIQSLSQKRMNKINNLNNNDTNKNHGTQDSGGGGENNKEFLDNKKCNPTRKSGKAWTQFFAAKKEKKKGKICL